MDYVKVLKNKPYIHDIVSLCYKICKFLSKKSIYNVYYLLLLVSDIIRDLLSIYVLLLLFYINVIRLVITGKFSTTYYFLLSIQERQRI